MSEYDDLIQAKRKVQDEVQILALKWSKVLIERHIQAALDPDTDPALAAKLRNDVLNWARALAAQLRRDRDDGGEA